MSEIELQRLERCKKCYRIEETDNFIGLGIKALICPLHGFECSDVIQCVNNSFLIK